MKKAKNRRLQAAGPKPADYSLRDLEAYFVQYHRRGEIARVETIAAAQGVLFLCPVCFHANGGRVGTHSVICWSRSRGVPEDGRPGPGRWALAGSSLDDLTLNADPPGTARSVKLLGDGCGWHGFVTNGRATLQ